MIADYYALLRSIEEQEGPGAVFEFCGEPAVDLRPEGSSFLYTLFYDQRDGWSAWQGGEFGCWPLDVEQQDTDLGPPSMTAEEVADALFEWAAGHPVLKEDLPEEPEKEEVSPAVDIAAVLDAPDPPEQHPMAGLVIKHAFEGAADLMRDHGGLVPPPAVHLIMEDFEWMPYAGHIFARPYQRGADAHAAVERLGLFPSVVRATRIVLVWEENALLSSLQEASEEAFPHAFVAAEATSATHTLVRQPFTPVWGPSPDPGTPMCTPRLEPVEIVPGGELPAPIAAAIGLWRECLDEDTDQTAFLLSFQGYRLNLRAPED